MNSRSDKGNTKFEESRKSESGNRQVFMEDTLSMLQTEVRNAAFSSGSNQAVFSDIAFYRSLDRRIDMPRSENPYLYMVIDGAFRLYTPSGVMDYMAGQYSVSKIDTPLYGTILSFSKTNDFYAVSIDIDVNDVIDSVLHLDNELIEKIVKETITEQEKDFADHSVLKSVYRLIMAMKQPLASDYLCKNIQREIIYYVLCGSCGKQFLQSITNMQEVDQIYEANSWIKENFHQAFTVKSLAEQQNMSVSLFHQKFKSAVGMGPLQCQKREKQRIGRRYQLCDLR